MLSNIQALILGVIEGLTEFLPISSTGHLVLLSRYLKIEETDFLMLFQICIQGGAIVAVLIYFRREFTDRTMLSRILTAFIPTSIIGLIAYKSLSEFLKDEILVAYALILGGIIMIAVEKYKENKPSNVIVQNIAELSFTKAFFLGVAQALAVIPGVSRSGSMIIFGTLLNIERKALVTFTFLLGVPTLISASLYTFYKKSDIILASNISLIPLIVGTSVSFIVAMLVIHFLLKLIRVISFTHFGIYRIILGIGVLLILL